MRARMAVLAVGLVCLVMGGLTVGGSVAEASTVYVIGFDHSEGVFGAVGSFHSLGTVGIAPEDQGRLCDVSVDVTNESLWQGTNLYLGSAGVIVAAADVESGDVDHFEMGTLVLGPVAGATLQLGPGLDGQGLRPEWLGEGQSASSLAGTFTIECPDVPPGPPEPPVPPTEPPTVTTPPAQPPAPPAAPVQGTPGFTG